MLPRPALYREPYFSPVTVICDELSPRSPVCPSSFLPILADRTHPSIARQDKPDILLILLSPPRLTPGPFVLHPSPG